MCPLYRGCSGSKWRFAWCRSRSLARFSCDVICALLIPILLAITSSCSNSTSHSEQRPDPSALGFRIGSRVFNEGTIIPKRFTCEGEDISPPLSWTKSPGGTRSLALIVEDPDAPAGIWTHWVVYNLPARTTAIPESVPKENQLPDGGLQGRNSFGHIGYGGPCPPPGRAHRYFFRLYALNSMLSLRAGASRQEVLDAIKGHVLSEAQLMGRFKR